MEYLTNIYFLQCVSRIFKFIDQKEFKEYTNVLSTDFDKDAYLFFLHIL